LEAVPTVRLSHLSKEERRAYVLADNKLAQNAGRDSEILAIELQALIDFDVTLTGFSPAEVDLALDRAREASEDTTDDPADAIPELPAVAASRSGDLWRLGRHRLLCGTARSSADVERVMQDERADLVFTDPPYNVPIDGHVDGLGSIRHREFAFAAGEMTPQLFAAFLKETLGNVAATARD
jgi:hypothetical protein